MRVTNAYQHQGIPRIVSYLLAGEFDHSHQLTLRRVETFLVKIFQKRKAYQF